MAGLTVADCIRHINASLGTKKLDKLTALDILNDAGEYLCTMHSWKWLERGSATLDFVAGQDYVDLPDDFRDVISVVYSQSLSDRFEWVDQERMERVRQGIEPDWQYIGLIENVAPATGGPAVPRLALSPTPGGNITAALTIRYAAGWSQVGRDADVDTTYLIVPEWCRSLMIRLCRIFAAALGEEDIAGLEERLEAIESSKYLDRLKERDGAVQPELGVLEGGAVYTGLRVTNWEGDTTAIN